MAAIDPFHKRRNSCSRVDAAEERGRTSEAEACISVTPQEPPFRLLFVLAVMSPRLKDNGGEYIASRQMGFLPLRAELRQS
jgi:hypothetical protein